MDNEMKKMFELILNKLDNVETRLDNVETRLGSLETRQEGIETRQDEIYRLAKAIQHSNEVHKKEIKY